MRLKSVLDLMEDDERVEIIDIDKPIFECFVITGFVKDTRKIEEYMNARVGQLTPLDDMLGIVVRLEKNEKGGSEQ